MQPLFLQTTPPPGPDMTSVVLVALPAVLGLASVFSLLPRPKPYPLWMGILFGVLALVFAGLLLTPGPLTAQTAVEATLFYLFAAVAILAGVLLVTQRN